jgi:hypothetical protein
VSKGDLKKMMLAPSFMKKYLISTISGKKYPFEKLEEFAENGESLKVKIESLGLLDLHVTVDLID